MFALDGDEQTDRSPRLLQIDDDTLLEAPCFSRAEAAMPRECAFARSSRSRLSSEMPEGRPRTSVLYLVSWSSGERAGAVSSLSPNGDLNTTVSMAILFF